MFPHKRCSILHASSWKLLGEPDQDDFVIFMRAWDNSGPAVQSRPSWAGCVIPWRDVERERRYLQDQPVFQVFRNGLYLLNPKIGARGFEPPTPWSRINLTLVILLVRLAWFWLMIVVFGWYLGCFGPKSDPNLNTLVGTKGSRVFSSSTNCLSRSADMKIRVCVHLYGVVISANWIGFPNT